MDENGYFTTMITSPDPEQEDLLHHPLRAGTDDNRP